jgi:purine-cytosine permease-like protein
MDMGTPRDWAWVAILGVGMTSSTVLGHFNHRDAAAVVAIINFVLILVMVFTRKKRKQ